LAESKKRFGHFWFYFFNMHLKIQLLVKIHAQKFGCRYFTVVIYLANLSNKCTVLQPICVVIIKENFDTLRGNIWAKSKDWVLRGCKAILFARKYSATFWNSILILTVKDNRSTSSINNVVSSANNKVKNLRPRGGH